MAKNTVDRDEIIKIVEHHELLRSARVHWEKQWQEVSDHCLGRRDFTTAREPGRQRMVRIYDTTAKEANVLLSAALHALLTNTATNWFDLKFVKDELNEHDESREWLSIVKKRMQGSFNRQEAAFSTQMHEFYSDLTGFCTGCIYIEDEVGFGPKFSARPLSEIFIDEDASGRIVIVQRRFKLKAWQAVDAWGKNAQRASDRVKAGKGDETGEYLHVVRQRDKPLPGNLDHLGMKWQALYIDLESVESVNESGFHENPYMVARWSKDSGELYGRGPGIDSLPDQKMLNSMWRTYIRNAEKQADPPLMVADDGVMPGAQVRITPSAIINIRDDLLQGGRPPLQYLEHAGKFELSNEIIATRTERIQSAFHSKIIKAFEDPRMTATQVLELARLSQRLLSPVLARMQTEALDPMLQRVYGIGTRTRNFFPPAPEILSGEEIQIDYVSPIARAQKQSESQAIQDSFAAALGMAQADPSVLDNLDFDVAIRTIFDANGVPMGVLRKGEDVIILRDERNKQQEAQQQLDQMSQIAGAGGKIAPVLQAVEGGQAAA